MRRTQGDRKDGLALLLVGVVLACPTITFAVVGDALATAVLVVVGLAISASVRRPLDRSTRSYVYTILAALIATVGQHQILPANADRFFLLPGEVYCPMLLYLAVSLTFFDLRDSVVAAVVALAVLATMISGNVVSFHTRSATFLGAVEDLDAFHRFYGAVVACQMVAVLLLLGRCARQRAQDLRPGRDWVARKVVFAVCLVLVLGVALALRVGAFYSQRRFQDALASLLRHYVQGQSRRTVFGRDVDLWRTAGLRGRQDQTVVLRVRGARIPGYLRGYAYRRYEAGRWHADETAEPLPVASTPGSHVATHVFDRFAPPHPEHATRLDVLPASGFRSQVLLAPGDAGRVELVAPSLRNSLDGELTPNDWDRRTGYVLVVPEELGELAYPGPNGETLDPESYLAVPHYLAPSLQPVAEEIFGDLPEDAPPQATTAALVEYMGRNFRYELGVRMDVHGGDPVVQFLTHWRRGHCELFAASATLLLRLRGIPARYVTGFVCVERPVGGYYYVSRLQDAHAWVEAFDRGQGRWVLVEPTPSAGVPSRSEDTALLWSLMDSLRLAWQQMLALMRRGYVAEAIVSLFRGIWACVVASFATPLRATVVLGVLLSLLGWLARRARRRRHAEAKELGTGRWRLRRSRNWLLRQFRRAGLSPEPADSLRRLLAKLACADGALAARLAPAIGEYERLRYGPSQPSVAEVRAFERGLRQVRRAMRAKRT